MALDDFEFDMLLSGFTPRLEVVDGVMVILGADEKPDRSNIRDWMRELKGDVAAVERMINHRHIDSVMPWLSSGRSKEQIASLAQLWSLLLRGAAAEASLDVIVTTHSSNDETVVTVYRRI